MPDPAPPRLPVPPGPAGVATVGGAVHRLLDGTSSGFRLGGADDGGPATLGGSPPVVIVSTSGSTGAPQQVVLPWRALLTSADIGAAALGEPGCWLTALPVTGVGGLLTVIRSLRAGMAPVAWRGVGGAAPFTADTFAADAIEALRRAGDAGVPAYCSLVPTQLHRALSEKKATAALRRFATVLVGGAALAPALRDRATAGGLTVVATYGATETAGGVVYDGVPLPGVTIDLPDGLIEIGGPTVAVGYRDGDPQDRFVSGRFRTLDRGHLVAGRLVVTGRSDQMIKVGGEKVSLSAITAVLLADPDVLDATTVARPDDEWGEVPHCYVVPRADGVGLAARLSALVEARLGRRSRPPTMTVVPELPQTAAGKPLVRDA